ncbi:CAMKK2 family protein [Megaselia abdita]
MESSAIAFNNGKPSRPPPPTRKSSHSTVEAETVSQQPLQPIISSTEIDKMRIDIIQANLEPQSETDMTQSPSDDDNDDVVVVSAKAVISPSDRGTLYKSCTPVSSSSSSTSLPRKFENLKISELRNSSISEVDDASLIKATTPSEEDDATNTPSACNNVSFNQKLCCLSQSSSTATLTTSSLSSLSPSTTLSSSADSVISDFYNMTSPIRKTPPIKTKSLDAHYLHKPPQVHKHHRLSLQVPSIPCIYDDDEDNDDDCNNVVGIETLDGENEQNDGNHHCNVVRKAVKTASKAISPQTDLCCGITLAKEQENRKQSLSKTPNSDTRPIYPNVPYSPYGSPYNSPRSNRRKTPLRESRRISIERSGSFLQLNQYKLMDQIGQGSYGLVKLAYSEEDSTHYAMKILSKRKLLRKAGLMGRGPKKTTSPLDRVYREIAVLKKLDHPNVVKLVEVLDDPLEDSLYLVFELVELGEILSIPTEKPLTEERSWSIFRDAVLGLEYLHYQRIIHADIKPGNLLLAEDGGVKIADLGVCNEFFGEDAAMTNSSTVGTPAFRAPETLIPGQHIYSGKAADIWALGATLYSLVYGNVPFMANSVPAVYEKIKHEKLNFPEAPQVSNDLKDLLQKILTKDPSKRITLPLIKVLTTLSLLILFPIISACFFFLQKHRWVTNDGIIALPSEDENCCLVQISDEDINSVVKSIPKLDTLILIKTMLKNHSFLNPFMRNIGVSGRAPQRGGSRMERFSRSGRSNSAPGAYHMKPERYGVFL